jgi:hypothetical protein
MVKLYYQHLAEEQPERILIFHCKDTIPKIRNKYFQERNGAASVPQFPHSCVCERFIYSHHRSAYSGAGIYVDECGNWD